MEKAFTSFLLTHLLLHYIMAGSDMAQTNTTTDGLELLSLKSQIISDPFHFLDESWSPAMSVYHWVGVTWLSSSASEVLESFRHGSSGRIPREFGSLTFLVSVDRLGKQQFPCLRNNSFTGSLPSSFSNISNLEILNLAFNSLEGHIPVSLPNASRLEKLELSYNSLQGNISEEIGNLHNMNWLSIQHNQLMSSIPFTIINISRIEIIAFKGNSLSGNLPNALCNGLPILKRLHLSENNLRGHMPTSLSNCSQLQLLSLSVNEFDGPIHSEIGRLSNLQILELGYNHFTDMFLSYECLYLIASEFYFTTQ
ncbi:hypothetical protein P3S67_013251 [Capsicum chacoense]